MELRVRFAETDQMRIAHHAAYVVWLEAARIEWLRACGLRYRDLEMAGVSLAVSGIGITYRRAARFDDQLHIRVTLTEVRSRRLRFAYLIERLEEASPPEALAYGHTLHTPTDAHGHAVRLPPAWQAVLGDWVEETPTTIAP
jgi:acyl-CoA thioester hydrolase